MFSITFARSRVLCRLLAAALLLTQFSLIAQATMSTAPAPTMHMTNCSEGMSGPQKEAPCPIQVCLQNLTQADKPVSVHGRADATVQLVRSVLFVVPEVSAPVIPQSRVVSLANNSDPPLSIQYCSFQL